MNIKIDWSKITDNVAVNCRTEEEAAIFVEAAVRENDLNNQGLWDGSGTEWYIYRNEMCYSIINNRLEYGDRPWCGRNGYRVIPFPDILIQDPERNQTAKADNGKLMLELIPPEVIEALGEVFTYGAKKYGVGTWTEVEKDRINGAGKRHLLAYDYDNQGIDEESGLRHVDHALCNMAILSAHERRKAKENNDGEIF